MVYFGENWFWLFPVTSAGMGWTLYPCVQFKPKLVKYLYLIPWILYLYRPCDSTSVFKPCLAVVSRLTLPSAFTPAVILTASRLPAESTMFLVGLSGGIASGKSTVVAVLRELGCAVIDADVIAREVVQPHFKAYRQIVHYFGTEILLENGEINREALGNIIFSHPEKRQLLNSITHPEIQKEMLKQIWKYFVLGYRYVILDIPLLFETNRLTKFMKYTVLVYCDPPTQLSRLMKRNRLSQAEAEARIASQLPLDEKRKLASHVIDNSGDRESTRQQVLKLHARLEDSLDFLWARLVAGTVVAGLGGLVYLLLRRFIS
uniref:Dephospho-CoA kinase domain-containing protein n=1 Tax=Accipiter nisus TaxID=211598 RepID=A0A8B9M039_9AVES